MKISPIEEVKAILGERQSQYGDFAETMENTAKFFNIATGNNITGAEVSLLYAINKIIRCKGGKIKRDSIIDAIAYLDIIDKLTDLNDDLPPKDDQSDESENPFADY